MQLQVFVARQLVGSARRTSSRIEPRSPHSTQHRNPRLARPMQAKNYTIWKIELDSSTRARSKFPNQATFQIRTLAVFSLPLCQTRCSGLSQVRHSEFDTCSLAVCPRLAIGTRPSRFLMHFGSVREAYRFSPAYEAPTFSQWDPAFSFRSVATRHSWRLRPRHSGSDHRALTRHPTRAFLARARQPTRAFLARASVPWEQPSTSCFTTGPREQPSASCYNRAALPSDRTPIAQVLPLSLQLLLSRSFRSLTPDGLTPTLRCASP